MPDLTDTYANVDGEFVFKTDETTPQQVVNALEDFTTFLDLFEVRSREYGDGAAFYLGSAGQFSDIYRKVIKLKTALWDKKPEQLTSEGTEEVVYDLIGHLFLTLQCLRLENRKTVVNPAFALCGADVQKGWYMEENTPAAPPYFDGEPAVDKQIRIAEKRAEVLRLYPQIGKGSLDARQEESLDWLIASAKPVPATGSWSVEPNGKKPDDRDWWYDKGDKVKSVHSPGSWLYGEVGTIIRRRTEDGGIWYAVDFEDVEKARNITCSQDSLEIVSRSKEWWAKTSPEGRGEPTLVADFERVAGRIKIKDAPQA